MRVVVSLLVNGPPHRPSSRWTMVPLAPLHRQM
jgi:hypothetical protein